MELLNKAWPWLKSAGLSSLAILAPIQTVLITVGVLIFLDLASGIYAAIKRKEKITSAVLRRTISKVIAYQLAVISAFIVEQYLIDGAIPAAKLVGGAIGLTELISILENSESILGQNIFKTIISKLGSFNDPRNKTRKRQIKKRIGKQKK